jgi:protease-4
MTRARLPLVVLAGLAAASLIGCINMSSLLGGRMHPVIVEESPRWFERNRIALIDIDGAIGASGGLAFALGGTSVADVREKLDWAARDAVKAVVLRIDSPGGGVTESDFVYREIARFREDTGAPVVACMMDTAASGAYYVALAADRIIAAPTCVTGSVGVLIQVMNVQGLFQKIGLDSIVVKSGEKKDMLSPTRAMTEEERGIAEGVARRYFDRFVEVMRERRPAMRDEHAALISDGRILTADEALDLRMIDRVGYLDDAIATAKELAGIEHADVVLYRPFDDYTMNIYASAAARTSGLTESLSSLLRSSSGPAFLYLWCPGP